jgi:hypothetical protein
LCTGARLWLELARSVRCLNRRCTTRAENWNPRRRAPDAGWDRIDGWWNLGGSIERFEHEPWSQRKDFGLKQNTSRQVRGEVYLDRAEVVIDGMWPQLGSISKCSRISTREGGSVKFRSRNDYVRNFCGAHRFRRLLLWRGRVVSPVAHAHRVGVTAVACVAGYLLIPHGEDAGAGKI